jgi:phage shock protein PspC (stress-responsive transcriptional regulator)
MWIILACFVSVKTFLILYIIFGLTAPSEKDHGQQRGA